MKNLLLLIALTISSFNLIGANLKIDTIDIKNAIDSNSIKLEIEGFYGKNKYRSTDNTGFYFGQCITIVFENITDSILIIKMPIGSILRCRDTNVQDMIVTKSFVIKLYPKYKIGYLIYAMCGEISDSGPSRGKFYDFEGLAKLNVVKTAQLIEEKNIQNQLGQYTMWAVRNNADSNKLMNYGASYSDLKFIVDNLDELNIHVKLTKQIPPSTIELDEKEDVSMDEENSEEVNEFEINKLSWLLMAICVVLALLIVLKSRKK